MILGPENLQEMALSIGSVGKAFTARPVLKDVSLDLPRGQAACLCGVNGAGKSTLLRIVAGLLRPDHGSVAVNGWDLAEHPEKFKRQLGMISHASMVYTELTVLENLAFAADLMGVTNRAERMKEVLAEMGLGPLRHDRAGTLSRGWLQRLAIARALLHKPALLLADEPFTGLDVRATERLVEIVDAFVRQGGSVLMTTHDTRLGLRCCCRVVVLDEGAILFDALTEEVDVKRFSDDYLTYARSRT